jgi:uncharacterized coiled-coil protein SlyX
MEKSLEQRLDELGERIEIQLMTIEVIGEEISKLSSKLEEFETKWKTN